MNIPYARQHITKDDINAVIDVLKSDWLTQGPTIEKFEKMVATYCGAKYAVAVNSATAALHIACLAANLGEGDILWTTPNTFVASANCARYCGAQVDFVDIDQDTYNFSAELFEKKIKTTSNEKLPKVIIPVHFSGQSCDMERISKTAREHGSIIIEDASHAIGGSYKGCKIGSSRFSDMTVFSFHPVKIITTGEGGMVVTNNDELYHKLQRLRSHGITRQPEYMVNPTREPWYYEQIDLGYNYRMTDIQAALGYSQMLNIDTYIARRHYLAERYDLYLKDIPVITPVRLADNYSAFHLYVIRMRSGQLSKSRSQIFAELRKAGIGVNVHYIPVHTQPYYRSLGFKPGDYPVAEAYYEEAISLPMYYTLTEEQQDYVISTLKKVIS